MSEPREETAGGLIYRAFLGTDDQPAVRKIDTENHTAEFVVATELPIKDFSWEPPTSLSMRGVNLKQYRRNPVVQADHGLDIRSNVGIAEEIKVDGSLLVSRVKFDVDDEFSNMVWGKVSRKFIRAASVGFLITRTRTLKEGDIDRKTGLEGPVRIATAWEPYEWSIVTVGADPGALARLKNGGPVEEPGAREDEEVVRFSLSGAVRTPKAFSLAGGLIT